MRCYLGVPAVLVPCASCLLADRSGCMAVRRSSQGFCSLQHSDAPTPAGGQLQGPDAAGLVPAGAAGGEPGCAARPRVRPVKAALTWGVGQLWARMAACRPALGRFAAVLPPHTCNRECCSLTAASSSSPFYISFKMLRPAFTLLLHLPCPAWPAACWGSCAGSRRCLACTPLLAAACGKAAR